MLLGSPSKALKKTEGDMSIKASAQALAPGEHRGAVVMVMAMTTIVVVKAVLVIMMKTSVMVMAMLVVMNEEDNDGGDDHGGNDGDGDDSDDEGGHASDDDEDSYDSDHDGDGDDDYSSCLTHCGHHSTALLPLITLPASQTQRKPASSSGRESLKEQPESHQHQIAP